jgi:hypothetical protein
MAPSSFDWSMAECFLALASSFSSDSAQSTASPYPWSVSDFYRKLSTTSCSRQHSLLGYSALEADRLFKGTDNLPSSIARPAASPPSCALLPPGRQGRPPEARVHHD